ncbi:hypothetical protein [Metabacillus endolithicus]|nr:hypothetical protein [Metabacillus endolithicus]UPG62350.1 hypothetical protein MVE64_17810 [Metabacillus endolithicus]
MKTKTCSANGLHKVNEDQNMYGSRANGLHKVNEDQNMDGSLCKWSS